MIVINNLDQEKEIQKENYQDITCRDCKRKLMFKMNKIKFDKEGSLDLQKTEKISYEINLDDSEILDVINLIKGLNENSKKCETCQRHILYEYIHTNIEQKPPKHYFCSKECKAKWIYSFNRRILKKIQTFNSNYNKKGRK